MLLCDAQTSGGLLMSVSQEKADLLRTALLEQGCLAAAEIGVITEQKEKVVEVVL